MKVTSPAFDEGADIPSKYTCKGEEICPPLKIEEFPKTTKCFAIIMDDPDAPGRTFVHWVIWNIPVECNEIMEGTTPMGSVAGTNDYSKTSYGGPCPPSDTHRYFFKVYALDSELDLPAGAPRHDLEEAMQNHIVDQAELVGVVSAG